MTVDLSTLKAGDTVEWRDGSRHVVKKTRFDQMAALFVIEYKRRKSPPYGENNHFWYRVEGFKGTDAIQTSGDIVAIHPATKE